MSSYCECHLCEEFAERPTRPIPTKTALQTVFMDLGNGIKFSEPRYVPVFEAEPSTIQVIYYMHSVITVTPEGDCERTLLGTGEKMAWYARPNMEGVVTMGMKEKIGGYCFQFHKDGSVDSSCDLGKYHWGPLEETEWEKPLGTCYLNPQYYDERDLDIRDMHSNFIDRLIHDPDFSDYEGDFNE